MFILPPKWPSTFLPFFFFPSHSFFPSALPFLQIILKFSSPFSLESCNKKLVSEGRDAGLIYSPLVFL